MRIASVVTVLGLLAAAFALPAAAQGRGLYIGYMAGQSHYNGVNCSSNCNDTSAGYGLFAGVGLTPNIAVEGGYADLGKSTFGSSNVRATLSNSRRSLAQSICLPRRKGTSEICFS